MRVFTTFIALLLLSGCAAQQVQGRINTMAKAEFEAWDTVVRLNQTQCSSGTDTKPVPRLKSLEKHECWASLVHAHVVPVAMAPDLLMGYLTDQKGISLGYKKGRIDRDEANLEGQKLWNAYYSALDARARGVVIQAQQQDQQTLQRMQAYSQEVARQEAAQERALQNSAPTNTNCTVWNNTMNCTTW